MKTCVRCGLPETYETIEFDREGVCNICRNHDVKQAVDWESRGRDLAALVEEYRGKYDYDCIIPFSGGKDSVWALWYLVSKFKIKPLVVQYNHGFMRPGLLENNERVIRQLGVDMISFRANWKLVKRVMLEGLIRRGDFCLSCHQGCFSYPMHVALKYRVPLIFWGETSTEYTAYYQAGEAEEVDETRFDRFVNLGITADDLAGMIKHDFEFDFRDLKPFTYPPRSELRQLGVRSVCLGSYIPWDALKQTEIIKRELGWKPDEVEGIPARYGYSKLECSMQGVRDYLKHLKRGYGRTAQMAAVDLRDGRMSQEEAQKLIADNDGKRPASLDVFLEYIGITEAEFNDYVRATVIPPHQPDFNRPTGAKPHDFDQWYREPTSAH